jgi:hypothetical protein
MPKIKFHYSKNELNSSTEEVLFLKFRMILKSLRRNMLRLKNSKEEQLNLRTTNKY